MLTFEQKDSYDFDDYRRLMALLRSPDGCPWDKVQTHESIRDNLIEEAYEAAYAIDTGDRENLCEELGDLLMQVLFHAGIEEDAGNFTVDDVCTASVKKLLFRHPHVFGSVKADTPEAVLDTWDAVKRVEKHQETTADAMQDVAENLPSLWRAKKIQKKAASGGLEPMSREEAAGAAAQELQKWKDGTETDAEQSLGKLLFLLVALARAEGIDPENALHAECERYIRAFRTAEERNAAAGTGFSAEPEVKFSLL